MMNRIGNSSIEQEQDDPGEQQAEEGKRIETAASSKDTETAIMEVTARHLSESGTTGANVHSDAHPNGSNERQQEKEETSDLSQHRDERRPNDQSPPKKRLRTTGELPQVVSVASALPPPPFVGKHQSAVLTESSLEESPADAEPVQELQPRGLDENMETPHIKNPPQEVAAASSPQDSPASSSSYSAHSPSSHISETSPLPPPPAPPSTPASGSIAASASFQDLATPRPSYDMEDNEQDAKYAASGVMENDGALVHERAQAAATPAPTRKRKAAGPSLVEDFSDWAVGDRYELIRILGRGSYGEVAQAKDLQSPEGSNFVAIKRITSAFDQEVDAVRLYREMHILRRLRGHECIIQLLDVVQPPSDDLDDFHDLYLVFEYVDTDLYKLIMSPQYLTTEHIQTFLYQMLAGLKYIHSSSVIHRDLKPANILLNEDCSLKICDFGLARIVNPSTMESSAAGEEVTKEVGKESAVLDTPISYGSPPKGRLTRQLTKHVVTRWYRAPELILIQPYTSAVDIWSLGCILAELLSMQEGSVPGYQDRVPLFPGGSCFPLSGEGGSVKKDERLDQLSVIFGVIGTPDPEDIASIGKANEYIKTLKKQKGKPFETLFPAADPAALDLLEKMLKFNPRQRVTAEEALEHDFLKGVRRREMEKGADQPLVGPDFLETQKVDLKTLKRRTYEEVLWYKDQGAPESHQSDGNGKLAATE